MITSNGVQDAYINESLPKLLLDHSLSFCLLFGSNEKLSPRSAVLFIVHLHIARSCVFVLPSTMFIPVSFFV